MEGICNFCDAFQNHVSKEEKELLKEYLKDLSMDLPYDSSDPDLIRDETERLKNLAESL